MKTILTREAYNALLENFGQLREILEMRLNQQEFIEAIEIDGVVTVAHYSMTATYDFSIHQELRAECETCPSVFFTLGSMDELREYINLQMCKEFATF